MFQILNTFKMCWLKINYKNVLHQYFDWFVEISDVDYSTDVDASTKSNFQFFGKNHVFWGGVYGPLFFSILKIWSWYELLKCSSSIFVLICRYFGTRRIFCCRINFYENQNFHFPVKSRFWGGVFWSFIFSILRVWSWS